MTEIAHSRPQRRRKTKVRRTHSGQVNGRLYELRLNAGLSREDLARRARISKESVRNAEIGYIPGPHIQSAIAAVFNLKPLDLWPIEQQRKLALPRRAA